jgi:hypothetical protein
MIKTNENGITCGYVYGCPNCGKEHGSFYYNITEQLPILCDVCLNDDKTDMNLRMHTIIYYMGRLQYKVHDIDHVTSGLRVIN